MKITLKKILKWAKDYDELTVNSLVFQAIKEGTLSMDTFVAYQGITQSSVFDALDEFIADD